MLLSNLALLAFSATAIVLPPKSPSATQIGNDIESIIDSIPKLTDDITDFNGPAVISDMRKISDILSSATQDIKVEDAVDYESAAFIVASLRDELQPTVTEMLDALIEAKAKANKAAVKHKVLGWLQNLRKMMQNLGTGLAPKVPLDRRSELQKVIATVLKDFDAAIKVYGGAGGIQPPA